MTELNGMGKFWERSLDEDVKNDALDRWWRSPPASRPTISSTCACS